MCACERMALQQIDDLFAVYLPPYPTVAGLAPSTQWPWKGFSGFLKWMDDQVDAEFALLKGLESQLKASLQMICKG